MAYQSAYSLRFRSDNSAYLSLTPAAGTQDKWKIRLDHKLGLVASGTQTFISAGGTSADAIYLNSSGKLCWDFGGTNRLVSTAVFRDPSARSTWEFIYDAANATAALRARVFVSEGGQPLREITAWDTDTRSSITTGTSKINTNVVHNIGRNSAGSNNYLDGLLDDVALIDNSATSGFSGSYNIDSGAWDVDAPVSPKWWLKFDTITNTTTLGNDSGSDAAAWTTSGFSVTAGTTNDALTDTATNYGDDTGAGGEVRGNYCTLNPLDNTSNVISRGNLRGVGDAANNRTTRATFSLDDSSGNWVWEAVADANAMVGIAKSTASLASFLGSDANGWCYYGGTGDVYNNGATNGSAGATYNATHTLRHELNTSTGVWTVYKDNVLQVTRTVGAGPWFPAFGRTTGIVDFNFGQRPWRDAPTLSGAKALCTQNLPDPIIVKPSSHMDVNLRSGTGAAFNVTGKNFQPDLVWSKRRDGVANHTLAHSIRGVGKYFMTSAASAEVADAQAVTAFNSDGFSGGTASILNANAGSFVDWLFKAGGAPATNNDGTIATSVSLNALAGISIFTYTGNGTGAQSVGHGLGVVPGFCMLKSTVSAADSPAAQVAGALGQYILMGTTSAPVTNSVVFNGAMTASVINIGNNANVNDNTNTMIGVAFSSIAGFSKFGTYLGNGSTDGVFTNCGFRPRFVLIRRIDSTGDWVIWDTVRDTYNVINDSLLANSSAVEAAGTTNIDILSNGFKLRSASANWNASGGTYFFMAFAELPFRSSSRIESSTFSLSIASGSYSLSGKTVGLSAIRTMPVVRGLYSLAGNATSLLMKRSMPITKGSYVVAGIANLMRKSIPIVVTRGLYAVTGVAAGLRKDFKTAITKGIYLVAGQTMTFGVKMPVTAGIYSVVGQVMTFAVKMPAAVGSYLVSGKASNLLQGLRVYVTAGQFTVTGIANYLLQMPRQFRSWITFMRFDGERDD